MIESALSSCQIMLNRPWVVAVIILAFALAGHGLLLISDWSIWDGWIHEEWITSGHWDFKTIHCSEAGHPQLLLYYHRALASFPNLNRAYKVAAFFYITFSAFFIFRILNQTGFVNRMESLLIALISLVFPAFRVGGEVSLYLFCYLVFLGCTSLAFKAEIQVGWRHLVSRIGALAGFFFSFYTGSLLVFYFGFFIALLLCEQRRRRQGLFTIPWTWLMRRIDYISLPFIFWGLKSVFTPACGYNEGYNIPSISVQRLYVGFHTFILQALVPSIEDGITPFGTRPIAILLMVIGSYVLSRLVYLPPKAVFSIKTRTRGLFGFGLLLLVLGTFPYMAMGAVFGSYGWETRVALLIALPAAIILVALLRWLFYDLGTRDSRLLFPVIVLMLCGFTASYIKTYVSWQALGAKDRSVIFNLSRIKGAADYAVIEVRNEFIIPETVDYYPIIHWTYQLKHAFVDDNVKRLVFETGQGIPIRFGGPPRGSQLYIEEELQEMIISTTMPYALTEIDLTGKQGILIIRRGPESRTKFKLAVKYWFYKIFRPEKMNVFLSGITSLELKPR